MTKLAYKSGGKGKKIYREMNTKSFFKLLIHSII